MNLPSGLIQIAGIIDQADAAVLVDAGVQWLGFPLRLPVHKEDISEADAAQVIADLPAGHEGVFITYLQSAREIHDLLTLLGTHIVQLHADIDIEELIGLRALFPNLLVIKSLVVRKDNLPQLEHTVMQLSPYVDAFITDTHDPASGADGATGKTHDWNSSRRLVKLSSKPLILAGGLHPKNVAEAIRFVQPFGVDAHTGIEASDGRNDGDLVRAFVAEARRAFKTVAL